MFYLSSQRNLFSTVLKFGFGYQNIIMYLVLLSFLGLCCGQSIMDSDKQFALLEKGILENVRQPVIEVVNSVENENDMLSKANQRAIQELQLHIRTPDWQDMLNRSITPFFQSHVQKNLDEYKQTAASLNGTLMEHCETNDQLENELRALDTKIYKLKLEKETINSHFQNFSKNMTEITQAMELELLDQSNATKKLQNQIEDIELENRNILDALLDNITRLKEAMGIIEDATGVEKYDCGMPPNISNPNIPTKEGNGSFRCQAVKNCEAVRCCNPSARDGEYEIYPELTSPHPIQVYCHSMSSTPREYITLHHLNQAFNNFSLLTGNCRWRKRSGDATTTFDKIRINITSMVVVEDDFTFTDITSEPTPETKVPRKQPTFGRAEDCSTWHTRCQKLGYFIINLKGTGLRLDPNLKWKTAGHLPSMDWFYNNGTVVEARCGGYCGWCIPSDPMRLFIDRADQ